jgi:hypothetical protein
MFVQSLSPEVIASAGTNDANASLQIEFMIGGVAKNQLINP